MKENFCMTKELWTVRLLVAPLEMSTSSIHSMSQKFGQMPHLVHIFKINRDPNFVNELHDNLEWLDWCKRIPLQFTTTCSSLQNLMEAYFAKLTRQPLKYNPFTCFDGLIESLPQRVLGQPEQSHATIRED